MSIATGYLLRWVLFFSCLAVQLAIAALAHVLGLPGALHRALAPSVQTAANQAALPHLHPPRWLRWRGAKPAVEVTIVLAVAYLSFYVGQSPAKVGRLGAGCGACVGAGCSAAAVAAFELPFMSAMPAMQASCAGSTGFRWHARVAPHRPTFTAPAPAPAPHSPSQGSGVISVVVFGLWGNFTSKWGMLSTAEESGSFDACERWLGSWGLRCGGGRVRRARGLDVESGQVWRGPGVEGAASVQDLRAPRMTAGSEWCWRGRCNASGASAGTCCPPAALQDEPLAHST